MCFSAYDRNFQWVCFIHLCSSDLKIKLTMISASLATVFLIWFCGSLFQIPVKNLNEWEQSISWEQVLLQMGGRRNAKVPEGEGLEKGRTLEIVGLDTDSTCFSFPPCSPPLDGPVGIPCHIVHIPMRLIREVHCISICCRVHTGLTLSLFETD